MWRWSHSFAQNEASCTCENVVQERVSGIALKHHTTEIGTTPVMQRVYEHNNNITRRNVIDNASCYCGNEKHYLSLDLVLPYCGVCACGTFLGARAQHMHLQAT
jgi:hypothetical protein